MCVYVHDHVSVSDCWHAETTSNGTPQNGGLMSPKHIKLAEGEHGMQCSRSGFKFRESQST